MGNNQSGNEPQLTNEEISECVKTTHFNEDEVKKLHKRFKIIAQSDPIKVYIQFLCIQKMTTKIQILQKFYYECLFLFVKYTLKVITFLKNIFRISHIFLNP